MHIRTAAGRRYVLECLLVKPGHHDVAVTVLEQSASHGDGLAFRRSYSYGIHPDAAFGDSLCRRDGVIFVILAIGDHDYGPAFLALGAETPGGGDYRIAYGCTLNGNGARVDIVQEHLRGNIVRGYRKLDERSPCEYHKSYPVVMKSVGQPGDGKLGPGKPVRLIIPGKHGVGDVQADHDLRAFGFPLGKLRAYQRTRKPYHEELEGGAEQHYVPPAFRGRPRRHQLTHEPRVAEAGDGLASIMPDDAVDNQQDRRQKQQPQKFGFSKIQHYGNLLSNSLASSSSSRHISAARA